MDYYVHKDGQQYGPYDETAMRAMLEAQQVLPTDLCWHEQLPQWTPIERLFPAPAPVAAPLPAPPAMACPAPITGRATATPAGAVGQATATPGAGRDTASPVEETVAAKPEMEPEVETEESAQGSSQGGSKSLAIKIAAGLVLLAAVGVGGWFLFSGKDKPAFVDFKNLEERNGLTYIKGESDPFTGKGKALFPDGKPMKEVEFVDGKEHGLMTTWYENGSKSYQANFVGGTYEGEVTTWTTNGVKQSVSVFQNGEEVSRQTWDEKGAPLK